MKIENVNKPLLGVDGVTPIPNADKKGTFLTLKDVCINAVLTPVQGEEDPKKKFTKYEIYKKLQDATKEVELTVEEVATIKVCIGKFNPPLILGQCFELLEG